MRKRSTNVATAKGFVCAKAKRQQKGFICAKAKRQRQQHEGRHDVGHFGMPQDVAFLD
ncbi:hypothetical protein [Lysinibacillus sp. NPDC056232]|uniref:hypothetical protein n=1 Tax=Lysinibacillus sp. NPDC056232 TaxID=3345756 RepID=UPI0035DCD651